MIALEILLSTTDTMKDGDSTDKKLINGEHQLQMLVVENTMRDLFLRLSRICWTDGNTNHHMSTITVKVSRVKVLTERMVRVGIHHLLRIQDQFAMSQTLILQEIESLKPSNVNKLMLCANNNLNQF